MPRHLRNCNGFIIGATARNDCGSAPEASRPAAVLTADRDNPIAKVAESPPPLLEGGEAPVVAHVLSLAGGEVRTRLDPAAVAAVFINPTVDDAASARAVATTFGLTPAETRVLSRVLAGSTVAEAAADLGVAATTARTHLDSIFVKTGVSRQFELIWLAAQITPAALDQACPI